VTAGTREVVFVAAPGPNGKVLLRADGRMVTSPIAPEELEREFSFEGMRFRFTRDGEALRVEGIGDALLEPETEMVSMLSSSETRWFGVGFLVAAVVALGVWLGLNDVRFVSLLRVALIGNAVLLAVIGVESLRRLWPEARLRKAYAIVPWIVVGSMVLAAMITDRALHREAEGMRGVHVGGAIGLIVLACAAGASIYFGATRRSSIMK
jgi:hypothetical protein